MEVDYKRLKEEINYLIVKNKLASKKLKKLCKKARLTIKD